MASNKVLILEDDEAIRTSCARYLKEQGYEVFESAEPTAARSLVQFNQIDNLIVDCLIPGESGVDFVKALRNDNIPLNQVIMISGIFTDPIFVQDTVRETKAQHFFSKPIDLAKLKAALPEIDIQSDPRLARSKSIGQFLNLFLLDRQDVSAIRSRYLSVLPHITLLHGLDLIYILHCIVQAELSCSLVLKLKDGSDQMLEIAFMRGRLSQVRTEDKDSRIGKLLVGKGYLSSGELEQALAQKGNHKLGEFLMSNHLISPHHFDQVLAEQMLLRLSHVIGDQYYDFHFSELETIANAITLAPATLETYFQDWIYSKLNLKWMRIFFNAFFYCDLQFVSGSSSIENLSQQAEHLVENIKSLDLKVVNLLNFDLQEELTLKTVFYLLLKGQLKITALAHATGKWQEDWQSQVESLWDYLQHSRPEEARQRLAEWLSQKDLTLDDAETLGGYLLWGFQQSGHPYLLSLVDPMRQRLRIVFDSVANTSLGVRTSAVGGKGGHRANPSVDALKLFDEAKAFLSRGLPARFLEKMESSLKISDQLPYQRLYFLWALLLQPIVNKSESEFIKRIEGEFLKIDPEEKQEALFHFVSGLYHKRKGQNGAATKCFEKALSIDSQMIQARRELLQVKAASDLKKTNILTGDLKDLVGQLFNKKR